jgi:hypothetical protein
MLMSETSTSTALLTVARVEASSSECVSEGCGMTEWNSHMGPEIILTIMTEEIVFGVA